MSIPESCCTAGFVEKKNPFWPLWLLFTRVCLQSICASPLGACKATSAIYSVCVFNTSTSVTCQRPHKLVNPIGFVWLLQTGRLIVLMGERKKKHKRKKRCRVGEGCLWSSDYVSTHLRFVIMIKKSAFKFLWYWNHGVFFSLVRVCHLCYGHKCNFRLCVFF